MAVNALDDMAYSNNLYTPRTETGEIDSAITINLKIQITKNALSSLFSLP